MKKFTDWIFVFFALLILVDFGSSCLRFYDQPILGDLVPLILPDAKNAPVLSDPFGIKAFQKDVYHPNINRFFSVASLYAYFRSVPFLFQNFVQPIESLYLSSSLLKIACYFSFFISLVNVITYSSRNLKDRILASVLILPLFQIGGELNKIALIDNSIVYLFFYGFPFALLLLFVSPFYKKYRENSFIQLNPISRILLILLGLFLAFSSAIMPPVIIIISILYLFDRFRTSRNLNTIKANIDWYSKLAIFMLAISAYSLFLGTYNIESTQQFTVLERYGFLSNGLLSSFKPGGAFSVLWFIILPSIFVIRYFKFNIWDGRFNKFLMYAGIFVTIYLVLLPLGGYRGYRPEILRNDTLIPISITVILISGILMFELVKRLKAYSKYLYIFAIAICFSYYSHFDYEKGSVGKGCEEQALYSLANAPESVHVIEIEKPCAVMTWWAVKDPKFYRNHAIMWQYWNITDREVLLSYICQEW